MDMNNTEVREELHKRIQEEPGFLRKLLEGTMTNLVTLFPDDEGNTIVRKAMVMCVFAFKNKEELTEEELLKAIEEITAVLMVGVN